MPVGELLTKDGEPLFGYYIILQGQCSQHLSVTGQLGKAMLKFIMKSAAMVSLEKSYPKYLDRKVSEKFERLNSMNFNSRMMV